MRPSWSWILISAATGLAISGIFSGLLHLSRDVVVLGYLILGGGLIGVFFWRLGRAQRQDLTRPPLRGVLGGLILGGFLAWSVAREPASPRLSDWQLALELVWVGLIYGALDALLLTVVPVLAVMESSDSPGRQRWRSRVMAFLASLLVAAVYHLGFQEYRGPALKQPLIGNGLITAAYLLTGNAFTPIAGHVIMHSAAVLHGPESTPQLPPHYPDQVRSREARVRAGPSSVPSASTPEATR
jgi:hypothetical protein